MARSEFQFHKGTIRTIGPLLRMSSVPTFQFHKGTIRTFGSESVVNLNLFQFHKGTIRTISGTTRIVFSPLQLTITYHE